jgi:hypothetical protein
MACIAALPPYGRESLQSCARVHAPRHRQQLCVNAARTIGWLREELTPAEFRQKERFAHVINLSVRV